MNLEEKANKSGTIYYENEEGEMVSKQCSVCKSVKELTEFTKNKTKLGSRASECRLCRDKYRKENLDTEANRFRKWHSNNRDYKSAYKADWQRRNKDKKAISRLKRRAIQKSLRNDFTLEQMENTLEFFGGCALTGGMDNIQWDHVIPLTCGKEGTTVGNMIPLRKDLNISKYNHNLFTWFDRNQSRLGLCPRKFESLINWLSQANGMSVEEYKAYVFKCHENYNE